MKRCILAVGVCAVLSPVARAQDDVIPSEGKLIAESKSVAPGGTLWVGLRITMKPRWHVYWKNPGDSGLAPKLDWTVPDGVKLSVPAWPAPHKIWLDPLMMYGYEGELLLPARIDVPKDYKGKTLTVALDAKWLCCDEICLDGGLKAKIEVPVRAGVAEKDAQWAPLFARTRAATPKAVDNAFALAWTRKGGALAFWLQFRSVKVPVDKESRAYFFPEKGGVFDHTADQKLTVNDKGGALRLTLDPAMKKDRIPRLRGVLVVEQGKTRRAYLVDLPGKKNP